MSIPTYNADVPAAPESILTGLHARTTRWPLWGRAAWWVLLLPLALALFSAGRLAGWPRRIGLGVAGLLALFVGLSASIEPPAEKPKVATFVSAGQVSENAAVKRQADRDRAAATAAGEQAARDRAAAEAAAAQAAADKAAAEETAAQAAIAKAAAAKAAAAKAAAEKAAAAKAAAEKSAAAEAAADRAAAEEAARQQAAQQQSFAAPAPQRAPASTGKTYGNCTELRVDYPGGVARPGAVDKRSSGGSARYTPFYSAAMYEQNSGKDRDGDDIACEA